MTAHCSPECDYIPTVTSDKMLFYIHFRKGQRMWQALLPPMTSIPENRNHISIDNQAGKLITLTPTDLQSTARPIFIKQWKHCRFDLIPTKILSAVIVRLTLNC